jgi:intein/homing endonuclease
MKKVIDSDHKISTRNRKKSSENTQFRLQIGSIEMCNDLRNLGFSERKTKSMVIPNIPQKFFADFVRGYFEGDGNVWVGKLAGKKKNSILTVFTSGSLEFLKSLKLRLFEANITKGGSLFSPKKDCYRLQFSITDSLNLYDFMYNSLIRGNSLFLQRKKSVFEKFLRMRL